MPLDSRLVAFAKSFEQLATDCQNFVLSVKTFDRSYLGIHTRSAERYTYKGKSLPIPTFTGPSRLDVSTERLSVNDLVKKSLSQKLSDEEILRLVRLSYYSRPLKKDFISKNKLEKLVNEKGILKSIRSHPLLQSGKPSTSTDQKTTSSSPRQPVLSKSASKSTPKAKNPTQNPAQPAKPQATNKTLLAELANSVNPIFNPCDDCLLPFSKLTNTPFPHVSLIMGNPSVNKELFSKCLKARLSAAKTHLRKANLPCARLPSAFVAQQIQVLNRSLVLELKSVHSKNNTKEKKKKEKASKAPKPTKKESFPRESISFISSLPVPPQVSENLQNPKDAPLVAASPEFEARDKIRSLMKSINKRAVTSMLGSPTPSILNSDLLELLTLISVPQLLINQTKDTHQVIVVENATIDTRTVINTPATPQALPPRGATAITGSDLSRIREAVSIHTSIF